MDNMIDDSVFEQDDRTKKAGLSRPEVIAIRLYTGPAVKTLSTPARSHACSIRCISSVSCEDYKRAR